MDPVAAALRGQTIGAVAKAETLNDEATRTAATFFAETGIFGKQVPKAHFDVIWQDKPLRMLRYRPEYLHALGWIPGFPHGRNLRGTVLYDPYVWLQIFASWTWMLVIIYKIESMGLNLKDERIYLLLFGTPYIGAVLNLCMLVTFILGLFVTLVLQRWWATRMEYGLARTTSIELAYIVCTNLRGRKQRDVEGAVQEVPLGTAAAAAVEAQNERARRELLRYLNFAHLLLLIDAQKSEKSDFLDSPDKRLGRLLRKGLSRVPVLRHFLKLEEKAGFGFGDILGNPKEVFRQLQQGARDAVDDVGRVMKSAREGIAAGRLGAVGLGEVEGILTEEQLAAKERKAEAGEALDDMALFERAGMVTADEWQLLLRGEAEGVPKWRTVYNWVAALMAEAHVEGRLTGAMRSAPEMQAMCRDMRDAGGRMFTMMNTQLPFTYVSLVSFICNLYLWVLTSYLGFACHLGMPGSVLVVDVAGPAPAGGGAPVMHMTGTLTSARTSGADMDRGRMIPVLFFFFSAFVNALVKGLISMHSLLENPFGTHPCKFPLRSQAVDHVRQTVALLRPPAAREPASIRDVFRPSFTASFFVPVTGPAGADAGGPRWVPPGSGVPVPGARLPPGQQGLQYVTGAGAAAALRGCALLDAAGAPLDLGSSFLQGRVADFTLESVEGDVGCVQAALDGGGELPATVWRLSAVRDDRRGTAATALEVAEVIAGKSKRQQLS